MAKLPFIRIASVCGALLVMYLVLMTFTPTRIYVDTNTNQIIENFDVSKLHQQPSGGQQPADINSLDKTSGGEHNGESIKNNVQEELNGMTQLGKEIPNISADTLVSNDAVSNNHKDPDYIGKDPNIKATFVTLARNRELYSLIQSIRNVEDRFNRKFNYDWVFLNDEDFTDEFKDLTTSLVSGKTKYGKIPPEHWGYPDFIDQKRAAKARADMKAAKIIYGDSESYRHMCRFESGFFWRNPLLDEYDWYWRVEPDIKIHCDLNYDLFKFMKDNNKKYGFTISIHEFSKTIPSLWQHTKDFIKLHPGYLDPNNMMEFISNDNGETYNLCHFWSNFEIADLNFWRSQQYSDYFDYLDKTGGFFYERWGDAPIHSIAAALFLDRNQIHYFHDVGYNHGVYTQCPLNAQFRYDHKCHCNPQKDFTFRGYSCGKKYFEVMGLEKPAEWVDYQ